MCMGHITAVITNVITVIVSMGRKVFFLAAGALVPVTRFIFLPFGREIVHMDRIAAGITFAIVILVNVTAYISLVTTNTLFPVTGGVLSLGKIVAGGIVLSPAIPANQPMGIVVVFIVVVCIVMSRSFGLATTASLAGADMAIVIIFPPIAPVVA